MKITLLNLLLLSLASFRLTRLIVFDKITEFIRVPFFNEIKEETEDGEIEVYYLPKEKGLKKFFGELLSCYWCTGIWTTTGIISISLLYPDFSFPIILILGVAGFASIIESIVQFFIEK
ncbi:DUF1360 domain-containing protein [Bacillaceae bacterium C204]|uniref:DUF1360 domain-containing protein n=1 Tax=Neobacillus sp. 204 TaxID=3383351 RepID=UPI00397B259E